MRSRVTVSLLLAACCACGGGGSGSTSQTNQINGAIASQAFAAKDAVSVSGSWHGFSFIGTSTAITISDYAALCTFETSSQQPPNTQQLVLVLAQVDSSGSATPPHATGEFPILSSTAAGSWAQAWYEHGGSGPSGSLDCFRSGSSYWASSGKVVVTSISSGAVSGTFDLTLTSGDHITGSFDAPTCAGSNLNNSLYCP